MVAIGSCIGLAGQSSAQENSTRKIRVKPNELSSRIGTAVRWEPDFAAAEAKSKATGKPIFWYVPTLNGTFMDRKPEIHRYMMAGPFSWPDVIDVINEHYIPVKSEPTRKQQETFQLVPFEFVEPGFLIVGTDGKPEFKIDRITTMNPRWIRHLLTRSILQPLVAKPKSKLLTAAWNQFSEGEYAQVGVTLRDARTVLATKTPADACESELLRGMAAFRLGKQAEAQAIWKGASESFPDLPLAWKAAAESQRIGPFSRGFEVFYRLPEQALDAGVKSKGSAAPPGTYTQNQLWDRGLNFLLGMQAADGGYTDSDYDFGGTDSLPNVHVAVTSLVGMAFLQSLERTELQPETRAAVVAAIGKSVKYVTDETHINRADRDEILWAYAYRLRFLSRCLIAENIELGISRDDLVAARSNAVTALQNVQSRGGGWYHEYTNPFVTATALLALHEAQQTGATVDASKVEKGLASLLSDRFDNGAFPYGSGRGRRNPLGTDRDIEASAGRMPLCELGLYLWGKSSDQKIGLALQRSLEMHNNLDVALKYDDHTSRLAYGGFFFWYDMRARSEVISKLPKSEFKTDVAARQQEIILALPELDGCFVDSHELGRVYGTAMALLSLAGAE